MQLFSQLEGWAILGGYALLMVALVWFFARGKNRTKAEFLVANRNLKSWESGFSIAATWVWAPALFIAAQKAYTQGWVGLFWFTVPNVLCLIVFAYFASWMRDKVPNGFTLSGYMKDKYSNRVQNLYLFQLSGLAICSFAVQLLAGGVVVSVLTGIPFLQVTIALSVIAVAYSLYGGIRASVITDYAQMAFICLIGFTFVPWAVYNAGGIEVFTRGLNGASGTFTHLFSGDGLGVFLAFGIPVTIGLMSGPFGDQSFWQRAFSVEKSQVKKAFVKGALIFATVPLLMSLLGFLAAGSGIAVKDKQLVNLTAVLTYLPFWTVIPFVYMLLSGLVSTLDSNLCAMSSMAGHDVADRKKLVGGAVVKYSRFVMFLFCLAGIAIANIPGIKILYLFLFYGTLRASTLLPTVISILKDRVSERGMFYGVLCSILIGLPVFAYGNFTHQVPWIITGSLGTILISGLTVLAMTRLEGAVNDSTKAVETA